MSTRKLVYLLFGCGALAFAAALWFPDYDHYEAIYCRTEGVTEFCYASDGQKRKDESCPPTERLNGRPAYIKECDGQRVPRLQD